jgi:hypothetical protein
VPKSKEDQEGAEGEEEEDSDSEPEDMDTEESSLMQRCISLINSPSHVGCLVRMVERDRAAGPTFAAAFSSSASASSSSSPPTAKYSGAEAVRNLCRVCHQLLMYNPQVSQSRPQISV